MILQGRDIQPEPSEKVRSPENNFEYVSDSLFFIPENKARAHSGGLCFTRQASILHAECLCQKGFQSSERLFQNLEQNKGLTEHLPSSMGQYVKQKGFNVDYL